MIGMNAETEYNNRARVPEHDTILARWLQAAAAFRAALRPETIAYGPGPREAMDLFLPRGVERPPVAMFFHGGYWQALDRSAVSHVAAGMVALGVAVAVPSYDLCPAVPLASICAQAEAAAAALHARMGTPMLVSGHSAGGHLAAWLLARMPPGMVAAALPISGLFWLEPLIPTSINNALGLDARTARALSPALLPPPGRPVLAAVGGEESGEFLRQSGEFAEAWGGSAEVLAGLNHFTVLAPLSEPRHPLTMRAAALARAARGGVTTG